RVATCQRTPLSVWDTSTGALLFQTPEGGGHHPLAFSADGKSFAAVWWGRGVATWDVEAKRQTWAMQDVLQEIEGLAYSPDGKRVVSADTSQARPILRVRDASDGAEQVRIPGGTVDCGPLAFHPDGVRLVTGKDDARILDVETGQTLLTLPRVM